MTIALTADAHSLPAGETLEDWVDIEIDGVTARATMHVRTAAVATDGGSPPPRIPPRRRGATPSPPSPSGWPLISAGWQIVFVIISLTFVVISLTALVLLVKIVVGSRPGPPEPWREPHEIPADARRLVHGPQGEILISGWDACPGEAGCILGEWVVEKPTRIYKGRSTKSHVVTTLRPNEHVQGLEATIIITRPGEVVTTRDYRPEYGHVIQVRKDDVFPYYYYRGEGCLSVSREGILYDLCAPDDAIKITRESEGELWLQIRNQQGVVGWSNQREHFHGTSRYDEDEPSVTPIVASNTISAADGLTTATAVNDRTEKVAELHTSAGQINIRFFPEIAPNHVRNFLDLASRGFYDGTKFHRVITDFMIQGGDPNTISGVPSTWGLGGSGSPLKAEFNSVSHKRGIVSMARAQDPDSASSQFFIVVKDSPFLDNLYTVFGQVTFGMDVVDTIVNAPRGANDRPYEPVRIERVAIRDVGEDELSVPR